ncbi:AI-2E family transporter [Candidatus Kaiserbacteria bacterium]|nr:AI-2E family transporter [Candidatus Kaiserbacteria bacterium]
MTGHTAGQYFLLLLLAGTLVLAYFIFQPFLSALVLSAVFAVILQPVYRRIHAEMPRWPSAAALVTVLISIVCILVPLGFIGTQIGFEAISLYSALVDGSATAKLSDAIRSLEDFAGLYVPGADDFSQELSANIANYAKAALAWLLGHLGTAFSGIASLFVSLFIFFVALYYLLRDGQRVKEKLVELSPLRDSYDESVFHKLELAVNSVIKGNLMIALIQGVASAIGFTIFGVPNPILWGTVTALAALIPAVGTGLVFIPIILFLLLTGNAFDAMGLTIWGVLAVGLVDNLLAPRLIGSGMNLHPLLVLLSVIGGITFFGTVGIFLGPLSIALLFAFLSIYSDISKRSAGN